MRPYEIVLIFDTSAEESLVDGVVERIRTAIEAGSGKLGQVDKWGRRRFAYEMKHRWEGYYALVELTSGVTEIAQVDRMLHLSDDVLRHKIVRVPESVAGKAKPAVSTEAAEPAETSGVSA